MGTPFVGVSRNMKNSVRWGMIAMGTGMLVMQAILTKDIITMIIAILSVAIVFHELRQL